MHVAASDQMSPHAKTVFDVWDVSVHCWHSKLAMCLQASSVELSNSQSACVCVYKDWAIDLDR